MCANNLTYLNLSTIFQINFTKDIFSDVHIKEVTFRRNERWWLVKTRAMVVARVVVSAGGRVVV